MMKREFLEGLSLNREIIDRIMSEHGKSIEKVKSENTALSIELQDLQAQNTKLTEDYENQKTAWEQEKSEAAYTEVLNKHLGDIKFTSKFAREGIISRLRENKLEIKDGKLEDFEGQINALKETEPDAFAESEQKPRTTAYIDFGGKIEGDEVKDDFVSSFRNAAGLKE